MAITTTEHSLTSVKITAAARNCNSVQHVSLNIDVNICRCLKHDFLNILKTRLKGKYQHSNTLFVHALLHATGCLSSMKTVHMSALITVPPLTLIVFKLSYLSTGPMRQNIIYFVVSRTVIEKLLLLHGYFVVFHVTRSLSYEHSMGLLPVGVQSENYILCDFVRFLHACYMSHPSYTPCFRFVWFPIYV
jgi:hypothetical protein